MATPPQTTANVRIEQLDTVFATRGDPARCWCQWFRCPAAEYRQTTPAERRARTAADLAAPGPSPGVVATVDDEPVGWCAVAPWSAYPRLRTSRTAGAGRHEPGDDRAGVWAVTCFVVRVGHRRAGVGRALLRAAVEHARVHGAAVLEGYPVDTTVARPSSAELFHGALSTFLAQGFTEVARPTPARAVVRLTLR
ncbi:GNAT family N-acetyltransferase [Georgenia sp. TF02-10]|uniref:GNAT family N-acetyltransferase n=1 Tax=Georgenia sp. TF02-10 TaxID=2917725 RepID=UPI001FA7DB43|nr:GNAT family N-acetyltransferase [Georgenia sp. TF02-10]UNX53679.1 GNAT family N-acetyltransferase [Georgenia sp. TF02-10]